jgi:hypothetical protein
MRGDGLKRGREEGKGGGERREVRSKKKGNKKRGLTSKT